MGGGGAMPQTAAEVEAAMLSLEDADDRAAIAGAQKEAQLEAAEFDDSAKAVGKEGGAGEEAKSGAGDDDDDDDDDEDNDDDDDDDDIEDDEDDDDDGMDEDGDGSKKKKTKSGKGKKKEKKSSSKKKASAGGGAGGAASKSAGESGKETEEMETKEDEAKLEAEFAAWQSKVGPDINTLEASLRPIERYVFVFLFVRCVVSYASLLSCQRVRFILRALSE